jgi:membrane protease YdiL (CAAX protease family)
VLLVPLFIKKRRTSRAELGYARLPSWTDILITPAGLVVYLILSSLLMLVVSRFFVKININQPQDVGFSHISQQFEYILAFITLVVIAPVAEETLFRGFLFSKLKKFMPFWAAILITSAIFGAIHGQWDLAIDTFALSVVLCLLREITGSLWASILLHMTKNGIAFYFLFINPLLLNTLVK